MTTSEWFPGEGRNADDEAFLARLRARAADDGLVDAERESSWAGDAGGILAVCVRAPGLPMDGPAPMLQVGLDLGDPERGALLLGAWETWDYVLDVPRVIAIDDVPHTPEGLADRAYEWLHAQLSRPVERREWKAFLGRPRSQWRFADDGEVICWTGSRLRRRGAPDRWEKVR